LPDGRCIALEVRGAPGVLTFNEIHSGGGDDAGSINVRGTTVHVVTDYKPHPTTVVGPEERRDLCLWWHEGGMTFEVWSEDLDLAVLRAIVDALRPI
jgi:hypothetical protein